MDGCVLDGVSHLMKPKRSPTMEQCFLNNFIKWGFLLQKNREGPTKMKVISLLRSSEGRTQEEAIIIIIYTMTKNSDEKLVGSA